MPSTSIPLPRISEQIWDMKYRLKAADGSPLDHTIVDTWARVAKAAAGAEPKRARKLWAGRFAEAMADFAFLPAGRILAGAGTGRAVTLFNCFVMGRIEDDLGSIFDNVKQAALTMQQGGGIGHDFSTLRPKGALVKSIAADASGPVSFMDVWDAMCRTIMSAGARRGAMMATLRCDHPDIEAFIDAKSDPARLRNFNLSVLVTDAFIRAVRNDEAWDLAFGGKVYRTLPARALWERMMRATYDYAEPGVVFIDRVNAANNLAYCEEISCTNPCGEQPLPPHGACLLGSINLARLVDKPFAPDAGLDTARMEALTATAVRFLDDAIDVSNYPLPAQKEEAKAKRRIGLGVTGLADALILCGARYGIAQGGGAGRGLDGGDQEGGLPGQRRAGAREGRLPALRCGALPGGSQPAAPARGGARRHRPARHAQRARHLDRPHRHHLAAGGQRLLRHRAGVRLPIRAPGARARRAGAHRDGGGLRPRPLSPPVRRHGAAHAGLRDGRGARAPRAPGDAGGPAAPRRQLHLQDHQLPGRHRLRGLQGRLSRGLCPGPQGLHDLPAECGDGRGSQPLHAEVDPAEASGSSAVLAAGRCLQRRCRRSRRRSFPG